MPQLRRHAKRKSISAERELIAFLRDPDPDNVRFDVPEDAPEAWGSFIMRDSTDPHQAVAFDLSRRFRLDANAQLVIDEPRGREEYTDAEGRNCSRTVWPASHGEKI
jgi:hypothetical protein